MRERKNVKAITAGILADREVNLYKPAGGQSLVHP